MCIRDRAGALHVSRTQRLKYFTVLTIIGLLLLGLSSLFIPLIMVRPHKFALLLTLGNLCIWTAIGMLRGPAEQFKELTSMDRLPFTVVFAGSIAMTFWYSMGKGQYLYVLFCTVLQVCALLWYVLSYFPGGMTALSMLRGVIIKAFMGYVSVCFSLTKGLLTMLWNRANA
eukprot:TRINITY_DN9351_c0_g1_i4.p2 TRINITY_DN9351_c0_g1~~TRINITY_DN9351_c0_g1_i4.p2  ORF type:complete len:171 (+),score=39.31 TRINITY_DN9351_c0_g1_i4:136-648(+)